MRFMIGCALPRSFGWKRLMIGPPSTWGPYFIPHDGHPTPLLNRMVADALIEYFAKAQRSH